MINHTIYKLYRNDEGYWEALILLPESAEPITLNGWDTSNETVDAIRKEHGEDAERVSIPMFQREVEARTTHSSDMLALLSDTYAGNLQNHWVYGSILRPMTGIRIEGATFLNAPQGAQYNQWQIYTYVVAPTALDKATIEHYDLVFISHP